jgi:hypothetical protein
MKIGQVIKKFLALTLWGKKSEKKTTIQTKHCFSYIQVIFGSENIAQNCLVCIYYRYYYYVFMFLGVYDNIIFGVPTYTALDLNTIDM